jgi:hypothetical protein
MNPILARMLAAISSAALALQGAAAACPLQPVSDAQLAQVLRNHGVRASASPAAILFRSKMALDDDGAPTAYHRGNADDSADPGLDHICNGGDVLELRTDRLVNKYASGGSIGALSGVDPASGIKRSRLCKRDYIAIRDSGFPPCGAGHLCMRFYGVAVVSRPCGFNRPEQMGCGLPIRQKDAAGNMLPFYLTRNIVMRPGSSEDSLVQSDFADASNIPFIVMPGGVPLPGAMRWKAGDLAIVVANGRTAYAVIGDSGPSGKLGEGSRALLRELGIGPTDDPAAVTTLLFPGTAARIAGSWPLDPARFRTEARALIDAVTGGGGALRTCPGLQSLE